MRRTEWTEGFTLPISVVDPFPNASNDKERKNFFGVVKMLLLLQFVFHFIEKHTLFVQIYYQSELVCNVHFI